MDYTRTNGCIAIQTSDVLLQVLRQQFVLKNRRAPLKNLLKIKVSDLGEMSLMDIKLKDLFTPSSSKLWVDDVPKKLSSVIRGLFGLQMKLEELTAGISCIFRQIC